MDYSVVAVRGWSQVRGRRAVIYAARSSAWRAAEHLVERNDGVRHAAKEMRGRLIDIRRRLTPASK